jgi:hypothetical protein
VVEQALDGAAQVVDEAIGVLDVPPARARARTSGSLSPPGGRVSVKRLSASMRSGASSGGRVPPRE